MSTDSESIRYEVDGDVAVITIDRYEEARNAVSIPVGIELYLGGELPRALTEAPFLGRLALALGVFSVGGVLNAQMQWKLNQKRFGTPS